MRIRDKGHTCLALDHFDTQRSSPALDVFLLTFTDAIRRRHVAEVIVHGRENEYMCLITWHRIRERILVLELYMAWHGK